MREVDGAAYGKELRPFFEDSGQPVSGNGQAAGFKYERPTLKEGKTRGHVRLATTDILLGAVQVFDRGGENIMHSHGALDGLWMVLKGRARFHFDDGETVDAGPLEGVCVPRNVRYRFEKIGDEPLEILQVEARHPNLPNRMEVVNASADEAAMEEKVMAFFDAKEE